MRLRSWCLVKILELGLVKILKLKFSRNADVLLRFCSWCLVNILKMKFDQDLCKNLRYDLKKLTWFKQNSTLGSVVPLAMFIMLRVVLWAQSIDWLVDWLTEKYLTIGGWDADYFPCGKVSPSSDSISLRGHNTSTTTNHMIYLDQDWSNYVCLPRTWGSLSWYWYLDHSLSQQNPSQQKTGYEELVIWIQFFNY